MARLTIVPLTVREATDYINRMHRHHAASRGAKFCLGASLEDRIVGVAMAGRPVSRALDDGWTLEVTRVATDGTRNACSFLYGAVKRVGVAMGYKRFVTYTLPSESGASLRACGWELVGQAGGGNWNTPSRPRVDSNLQQVKLRWESEA